MIVTEEEARTKWCPEVRLTDASGSNYGVISNRDIGVRHEYCIASKCMWWRWTTEDETFGYCGKAGKP